MRREWRLGIDSLRGERSDNIGSKRLPSRSKRVEVKVGVTYSLLYYVTKAYVVIYSFYVKRLQV